MVYSVRTVAFSVLLGLLGLIALNIYTHHALQSHPHNNEKVVSLHAAVGDKEQALLEALWAEDGFDQELFVSLNSCNYEGCGKSIGDHQPLRIGLLAPPGRLTSEIFLTFGINFADSYSNTTNREVRWIPTAHIPRTNSNYTHIVRFAMIPILLTVGDVLLSVESSPDNISWLDIQETLKLLLSWHCLLSNLADAEVIPLISMSMEEIEADQYEQEGTLNSFLSPETEDEPPEDGKHMDEDELETNLRDIIENIKKMLKAINKDVSKKEEKGIVSLTRQIIHNNQCQGKEDSLYQPNSPLSKRVYTFLKPGTLNDDIAACLRDGSISNQLACTKLAKSFPDN